MEKELQYFQDMQIFDNGSTKSASSVEESVESGKISSSNSKWKTGSNELFVTCLNCESEHKFLKKL